MQEHLICYSVEKATPTMRTSLHRELYGYKDFSNHGKYSYQRKGIVQRTQSKKIMDCVLLTSERHVTRLVRTLRKYNAKIHVFTVILTKPV